MLPLNRHLFAATKENRRHLYRKKKRLSPELGEASEVLLPPSVGGHLARRPAPPLAVPLRAHGAGDDEVVGGRCRLGGRCERGQTGVRQGSDRG